MTLASTARSGRRGAVRALRDLERLQSEYGGDAGARKLALLRILEKGRLDAARQVKRLHEALCFLRAYPDDAALMAQVESMLDRFASRRDLRRHRAALADTGIAGTDIHYRFFWFTARWLVRRWPDRMSMDWNELENRDRLLKIAPLLLPQSEALLQEHHLRPRDWVRRAKSPRETDAAFLVRRFETLGANEFSREMLYEDLDPMLRLSPGPGTPSRTHAVHVPGMPLRPASAGRSAPDHRARLHGAATSTRPAPIAFQLRPLDRRRPDLRGEWRRPPAAVHDVQPREARRLIDLARAAMVTRSRDLDAFEHADENDVRLVDCGGGLQFACMGTRLERRLLLDANYGCITLHNRVPIGYVLVSTLFGSAAVAYNIFETFRGAEAARIYGRLLGTIRHLFGCDAFSIDPYQLGHHNPEGLRSGAWWFYYKMGFRPEDAGVRRLVRAELQRMRHDTRHRSTPATLRRLVAQPLFLDLGRRRADVMGRLDLGRIGLHVTRFMAERFGAERERGAAACSQEAAGLLGLRSQRGWTRGEMLAWQRWSPLIVCLPGVERWSAATRQALVRVVRAKGASRESDFVRLFDQHRRLRGAVARLAR